MKIRLDKFLASVTDLSRREVVYAVKDGEVFIGENIASSPSQKVDPQHDIIKYQDEVLHEQKLFYVLLNKPKGCLSATTDSHVPTVVDLVSKQADALGLPRYALQKLQICGRLDADTTGIIFLTNDGQWNHEVTKSGKGHFKTYRVDLEKDISKESAQKLENGIMLHGEKKQTLPAKVEILSPKCINLSIQEGKYHQIKRMIHAVKNEVLHLHRWRHGNLELPKDLESGDAMLLSPESATSI